MKSVVDEVAVGEELLELAERHLEAGRRCAERRPVEALARAVWARELVRMAVARGLGTGGAGALGGEDAACRSLAPILTE